MLPQWARNKKILLGVSGGIAAYKIPELVREWLRAGCEVEVILTEAAAKLVSPLALSTLLKRRVWRECDFLSDELGWTIPHITLSGWADVFVVAPCSANTLQAAATGAAGTLLGAAMLACRAPVILFPAMNSNMWANPAVKANAHAVSERGYKIIDPDSGMLACGYEGEGRLPSTPAIVDETWFSIRENKDFAGKKALVTAGPTHEYIDPVRFISNPSTGKMGCAIAAEARYRGAEVVLVSGPTNIRRPSGVRVVGVTSAAEMRDACLAEAGSCDVIIKAAAVGDYRAKNYMEQKIKRGYASEITLDLAANADIAAELGRMKKPWQILVGFAAETDNMAENATAKLDAKQLDIVAANDVSADGEGFASDTNRLEIFFAPRHGQKPFSISGSKWEAASGLLDAVASILPVNEEFRS